MENINIYQLVDAVKGEFLLGDPHTKIQSISTDTRTLRKGDVFFALSGKNYNAHDFLNIAVEKKAIAVVISQKDANLGKAFPYMPAIIAVKDTTTALGDLAKYYRKKFDVQVTGITGSNGKTTTKEMTTSIIKLSGPVLKNDGNFNNNIGLPLSIFNLSSEHKYAVLEMGTNSFGEIRRLAEIAAPSVGAITNIGLAHLESFIDDTGVLNEKRALVDSLDASGCAIINVDDDKLKTLIPEIKSNIITYGFLSKADVYATEVKLWPGKPKFKLNIDGKAVDIELSISGMHNIYNALCSSAIAFSNGLDIIQIKTGLESFIPPKMRMTVVNLANGITLVNDAYNANPSSMKEAIKSFVESYPERDKVVVLGDMLELGNKANEEHSKIGEFLSTQPVSHVYLYGKLMENAVAHLQDVKTNHFMNKEELQKELMESLPPRAVVLFKGSRSMKLEEISDNIFKNEERT